MKTFQIKIQGRNFDLWCNLTGSLSASLEEMPVELREGLLGDWKVFLEKLCYILSVPILAPIMASFVMPKIQEVLQKVAIEGQDKLQKAKDDEMEIFANGKLSSTDN